MNGMENTWFNKTWQTQTTKHTKYKKADSVLSTPYDTRLGNEVGLFYQSQTHVVGTNRLHIEMKLEQNSFETVSKQF